MEYGSATSVTTCATSPAHRRLAHGGRRPRSRHHGRRDYAGPTRGPTRAMRPGGSRMRRFLVGAAAALLTPRWPWGRSLGRANVEGSAVRLDRHQHRPPRSRLRLREAGSGAPCSASSSRRARAATSVTQPSMKSWLSRPDWVVEGLFCASRSPTIGGVTLHGVGLHIFYSGDVGADAVQGDAADCGAARRRRVPRRPMPGARAMISLRVARHLLLLEPVSTNMRRRCPRTPPHGSPSLDRGGRC